MSLLLKVEIDNEVKAYKSYINSMNQIMKNAKKSSVYTIKNGICFAMREDRQKDYFSTILQPKIEKKNLIKVKLDENVKCINGKIDGTDLFAFYKNHKTKINGFEFYSDHFKILTTEEDVAYISERINNSNYDLNRFKEYLKSSKEIKLSKKITLTEEELNTLKTIKNAYIIERKDIKLRINNALILNNKIDQLTYNLYDLGENVYRIENINNLESLFICKQFFKIINY